MPLDYYLILPLLAAVALALDWLLGEPQKLHPLIGFGNIAKAIETHLNRAQYRHLFAHRIVGLFAVFVLLTPIIIGAWWLCHHPIFGWAVHILCLYFAIGHKSLYEHAQAVLSALHTSDTAGAKLAASYMVSRDAASVDAIPATIESVLENGNDSVFGTLFWFLIAGGAGALAFRLINTLDAMWGYRNTRFLQFGWASARLDDVVNYIPARLTALSYALLGHTRLALQCWQQQAPNWDSPNAGPVMAAGAGALNIALGGAARYHGEWHERPVLGGGTKPVSSDITRALTLVRRSVYLWLATANTAALSVAIFVKFIYHA